MELLICCDLQYIVVLFLLSGIYLPYLRKEKNAIMGILFTQKTKMGFWKWEINPI